MRQPLRPRPREKRRGPRRGHHVEVGWISRPKLLVHVRRPGVRRGTRRAHPRAGRGAVHNGCRRRGEDRNDSRTPAHDRGRASFLDMTQLFLPLYIATHGYILHMWTGIFTGDDQLPLFFRTKRRALGYVSRCPSWGRSTVTVYACERRVHVGAEPDYIVGDAVANGLDAPP